MATLQGTLASLQVHNHAVDQAHEELEHLKQEIVHAREPQEMRDVQGNLQIVHARELLLSVSQEVIPSPYILLKL